MGISTLIVAIIIIGSIVGGTATGQTQGGTVQVEDVRQTGTTVYVEARADVSVLGYYYFMWDWGRSTWVSPTGAYHALSQRADIPVLNLAGGDYAVIIIGWTGTEWTQWSEWHNFTVGDFTEIVPEPTTEPRQPAVLDGLVVEREYTGSGYSSSVWKRSSWSSSVNKALGWLKSNCKWAFYSARSNDCMGNNHRDHLVARKEAFESGGHNWSREQVLAFDKYTANLYVLPARENTQKSDKDAVDWKPQDTDVWCRYAQETIAIKRHWGLSIDTAEKEHLTTMLAQCE